MRSHHDALSFDTHSARTLQGATRERHVLHRMARRVRELNVERRHLRTLTTSAMALTGLAAGFFLFNVFLISRVPDREVGASPMTGEQRVGDPRPLPTPPAQGYVAAIAGRGRIASISAGPGGDSPVDRGMMAGAPTGSVASSYVRVEPATDLSTPTMTAERHDGVAYGTPDDAIRVIAHDTPEIRMGSDDREQDAAVDRSLSARTRTSAMPVTADTMTRMLVPSEPAHDVGRNVDRHVDGQDTFVDPARVDASH